MNHFDCRTSLLSDALSHDILVFAYEIAVLFFRNSKKLEFLLYYRLLISLLLYLVISLSIVKQLFRVSSVTADRMVKKTDHGSTRH